MRPSWVIVVFWGVLFAGCSTGQLSGWDRFFKGSRDAGSAVQSAVESPGGQFLPVPIKVGLEAVGGVGVLAYGIWQKIRASKVLEKHNTAKDALGDVLSFVRALQGDGSDSLRNQLEGLLEQRGVLTDAAVAAEKNGKGV